MQRSPFSPAPFLLFTLSVLLLLVACTASNAEISPTITLAPTLMQTPAPSISPTREPSATSTPTNRPTRRPTITIAPPKTPAPTLTLSVTPLVELPLSFAGTNFPQPNEIISPENASRLVKLAQWGHGRITDIAYSLDGALLFVETSIGGAVFEVTNLEEPLEVYYQPLEEEFNNFEWFENDIVDLNEIQARYDLDIPTRIFPFQAYGFQELGCDESFPFTPHLRDAEAIQAQYSPLEQNFFFLPYI
ncbi:MAG: hypothetical protein HUU38_25240 [Anaerolineales bacterium]|nr:hypothetical protein [Anaerolineales bacterium]